MSFATLLPSLATVLTMSANATGTAGGGSGGGAMFVLVRMSGRRTTRAGERRTGRPPCMRPGAAPTRRMVPRSFVSFP